MHPTLIFHGAAGTVTGSCLRIQAGGTEILVDCGLFQGSKTIKSLNWRPFPFEPRRIAAVVLTHAHIDHAGLIPRLFREGFTGPVVATDATADLCAVLLPDSGYIQETEVERLNRRNAARGRQPVAPIYTRADAEACLASFRREPCAVWFDLPGGDSRAVLERGAPAGLRLGGASPAAREGNGCDLACLRRYRAGREALPRRSPEPQGPGLAGGRVDLWRPRAR